MRERWRYLARQTNASWPSAANARPQPGASPCGWLLEWFPGVDSVVADRPAIAPPDGGGLQARWQQARPPTASTSAVHVIAALGSFRPRTAGTGPDLVRHLEAGGLARRPSHRQQRLRHRAARPGSPGHCPSAFPAWRWRVQTLQASIASHRWARQFRSRIHPLHWARRQSA
ncbi:hypothetical protein D3C72_1682130 [compost metagenome]